MSKKITRHRVRHKKDASAGSKTKFSGSPGKSKTMKNSASKLPKAQSVHQHSARTKRARRAH